MSTNTERPKHPCCNQVGERKSRNRKVLGLSDFTDDDIAAIERAKTPDEACHFDNEVK
jgi:hypothetical protein